MVSGSSAPLLKVLSIERFEQPYRLRLPFRFGVITVTHGLQAIVRVRVAFADGGEAAGHAAEALAAKWFDKNPVLSDDQNVDQLRRSLELASDAYLAAPWSSAFTLFADRYASQLAAAASEGLPSLVAGYGPSLLDRAVLDALCRMRSNSFAQAIRSNLVGLRGHDIAPDLQGADIDGFRSGLQPHGSMAVRHTVGLLDPIVAGDQAMGTRVNDGLPETLAEVVTTYGNRWFKLKVSGDLDVDIERLGRIASVLDAIDEPVHVSLDGNEQFESAAEVVELWRRMLETPALARLCASTLFIEQPIKRAHALSQGVGELAALKPVIIDESDGEMSAFPSARALGYTGVSSKTCKGLYKSIVNRMRCDRWNQEGADSRFFLSAEDLTTQPGLSIQQDLALVDLLGITHVERNAHHFIDGFAERPDSEALAFLQAHPDLYHLQDGRVRLKVADGRLSTASLDAVGFASTVQPCLDDTPKMPASTWRAAGRA